MKKIQFFCDICSEEFLPQEHSFLTGWLIQVDKELKAHQAGFEGHYCGKDTRKVLEYIDKLKNEQRTSDSGTEQSNQSHSGNK